MENSLIASLNLDLSVPVCARGCGQVLGLFFQEAVSEAFAVISLLNYFQAEGFFLQEPGEVYVEASLFSGVLYNALFCTLVRSSQVPGQMVILVILIGL